MTRDDPPRASPARYSFFFHVQLLSNGFEKRFWSKLKRRQRAPLLLRKKKKIPFVEKYPRFTAFPFAYLLYKLHCHSIVGCEPSVLQLLASCFVSVKFTNE